MPRVRVSNAQRRDLKKLRDTHDAFCPYGTPDAVAAHINKLPLTKASFVLRVVDGGPLVTSQMPTYSFTKFVGCGWLRCIESDKNRPNAWRFRWRLTKAGKRACWHKTPPEGTDDDPLIEVE